MDLTTIYLLTVLPDIGKAVGIWAIIFFVVSCCAMGIFWAISEESKSNEWGSDSRKEYHKEMAKRYARYRTIAVGCIVFFVSLNLLSTAIPDRKQMMVIAGMYFGSNIDGIKDLPPNIVKAVNSALEQFVEKKDK